MRRIDIERLELPEGWETRAARALNELRAEVDRTGAEAAASGRDRLLARRAVISGRLRNGPARRIWQALNERLAELGNRKCWYSETKNPGSDKEIDHFRPKASVDEDGTHEGYWWLAFDWQNFRYSCQWCNQVRNEGADGTRGGKGDRFPLEDEGTRARGENEDYRNERPTLLDPVDPADWRLLTFRPDGYPTPSADDGTTEYERARVSIEVYHLDSIEMVRGRKSLATKVARVVGEIEELRPSIGEEHLRQVYRSRVDELLELMGGESEYSKAAVAYVRGEVWTFRHGRHERRAWLANIVDRRW